MVRLRLLLFGAAALVIGSGCTEHEPDEREVTAEILHGGPVTAVAFSPDATILASASEDDTIRLLDVTDFHMNFELPTATTKVAPELESSPLLGLGTGFRSLTFTPDGLGLAAGNYRFVEGGVIKIWDVASGDKTAELVGHSAPVLALDYAPWGGFLLASGAGYEGVSGEGFLWSVTLGAPAASLSDIGPGPLNDVAFSPDGELVAGACEDGAIRVWNAADGSLVHALAVEDHTPRAVAFSPDGLELASVGDDAGPGFGGHGGVVRLWNVEAGELESSLDLETAPLRDVSYSHDGSLVAAAGDGHRIHLVDPWSGELVDMLKGHSGPVNSVDFSSNGQLLVSGSDDYYVRLWFVGDLVGETCHDGMDNDGDGWIDANDPDCEDGDQETGFGDAECNDDNDNDDDGYTDAADPDCTDGFDDDELGSIDGGPGDGGPGDGGPDGGDPDGGA
jgi:WD40 repeat protein